MRRSYEGPPLDLKYQYITERPELDEDSDDGETVYATDPEPQGEETVENVPTPEEHDPPSQPGQTTIEDWRWSA